MNWKKIIVVSVAALAFSGCTSAPSITSESLEEASVTDQTIGHVSAQFASSNSAFSDMWMIDLDWPEVPDAVGYQLQVENKKNDQDEAEWENTKFPNSDNDGPLVEATSGTVRFPGFDAELRYRVRAAFEDNKVSQWTESNVIEIPTGNVRYEVDGTGGPAFVTVRTASGTQQATIYLPMKNKDGKVGLTVKMFDTSPYISAQAKGYGDVVCRIYIKEVLVASNRSVGQGSIATCSP